MYLFINTSEQGKIRIALFNSKALIVSMSKKGTVKLTEKLVFFITQLLKKQRKKFIDLKGIIVVTGPGSFTSVRIGCVIANTLAQVLKIGIYGDNAEKLTSDELILKSIKKLKQNNFALPFYDREPNITIGKEIRTKN